MANWAAETVVSIGSETGQTFLVAGNTFSVKERNTIRALGAVSVSGAVAKLARTVARRTVGSKEGRWVELSKSQTVLAVSVGAASSGTVTIAVIFAFVGSKDIQSLIVDIIEADTVDFIASAGI